MWRTTLDELPQLRDVSNVINQKICLQQVRSIMNVMYVSDDNYAMIMGISILSLLDNNKDIEVINIFWVADNVSESNVEKVKRSVEAYNRNLFIIRKPDIQALLGCDVIINNIAWVENIFSRVFLGEIFKEYEGVDKLIYVDCDTLVIGSLKDLWNLELGNLIGAAVCEAMGNLHKKAIGLSKEANYFNSGVFLIDLVKWQKNDIDSKVSNFVKSRKGRLEYPDESILNGVLSMKLKRLSPKYNLTSLSVYFTAEELKIFRKSYIAYSEDERQKALADARIIHFTATYLDVRPWVENCQHPYADRWLRYKEMSLWADEPCMRDNRSAKMRLARKVVLLLPKYLRLQITGAIHAYIKPLKYVL